MKIPEAILSLYRNLRSSPIALLVLLAFLLRLAFTLFVAKFYFGRENIYVDGDTGAWTGAFQTLLETGTYTVNPGLEYGYFGRMPGYSFFVGIFYLLAGLSWERAFPVIAFVQMLLDSFLVFFIHRIALKLSGSGPVAITTAVLAAAYPFLIVWTPVVYSEELSVFLLVFSFWSLLSGKKYAAPVSGAALAISVLCRPQALLMAPLFLLYILWDKRALWKNRLLRAVYFGMLFSVVYGVWPLRNYCIHGKFILTQDIRGFYNWNEDVVAFLQYIYSVKSEWEPQYTQLIRNQHVIFPDEAYTIKSDSIKLERAVWLAQNCGSGFSHKSGFWKQPFDVPNCNEEIRKLFTELRDSQVKNNPWNFYVKVPVQNLKKALFKTGLNDQGSWVRKMASLLFYYRSLMLLLGIVGAVYAIRTCPQALPGILVILGYFLLLYLMLCAGTSLQMRNIEMRYFLPADVLMLIPASFLVNSLYRPHKIIRPVV